MLFASMRTCYTGCFCNLSVWAELICGPRNRRDMCLQPLCSRGIVSIPAMQYAPSSGMALSSATIESRIEVRKFLTFALTGQHSRGGSARILPGEPAALSPSDAALHTQSAGHLDSTSYGLRFSLCPPPSPPLLYNSSGQVASGTLCLSSRHLFADYQARLEPMTD